MDKYISVGGGNEAGYITAASMQMLIANINAGMVGAADDESLRPVPSNGRVRKRDH